VKSTRRVRVNAAVTAIEAPGPAEPGDADATLPLASLPARVFRTVRGGEPATAAEPGFMAGAVRGLLATPWFAAATGLVVAASLWIYAPHAELRFPPSASGAQPCLVDGCGITPSTGGGSLATTNGQAVVHSAKSRRLDADARAIAGLTFSYVVLWHSHGRFGVMISVTGRHRPSEWKLTFVMPGDRISAVMGADWQPSGASAGTASAPSGSAQGQWPGANHRDPGGPDAQDQRDGISFLVVGRGRHVVPTSCTFNGASCTFS
jgi:hypothetical protein